MKTWILISLIAVFLSGCSTKKVLVRVEMPTPPAELMEPPKPLKKIAKDTEVETPKYK